MAAVTLHALCKPATLKHNTNYKEKPCDPKCGRAVGKSGSQEGTLHVVMLHEDWGRVDLTAASRPGCCPTPEDWMSIAPSSTAVVSLMTISNPRASWDPSMRCLAACLCFLILSANQSILLALTSGLVRMLKYVLHAHNWKEQPARVSMGNCRHHHCSTLAKGLLAATDACCTGFQLHVLTENAKLVVKPSAKALCSNFPTGLKSPRA